jgi:hypothetical protein
MLASPLVWWLVEPYQRGRCTPKADGDGELYVNTKVNGDAETVGNQPAVSVYGNIPEQ